MRYGLLFSALLLLGSLAGCGSSSEDAGGRPPDFTLQYQWVAGSMPPPHHYEYTIALGPGDTGKMILFADYPSDKTPSWIEEFSVDPAQLNRLYILMRDRELLRQNWRTNDPPMVGGAQEYLAIKANQRDYSIPSDLVPGEQAALAEVYTLIRDLVPRAAWNRLMALREKYVQEYEQ